MLRGRAGLLLLPSVVASPVDATGFKTTLPISLPFFPDLILDFLWYAPTTISSPSDCQTQGPSAIGVGRSEPRNLEPRERCASLGQPHSLSATHFLMWPSISAKMADMSEARSLEMRSFVTVAVFAHSVKPGTF